MLPKSQAPFDFWVKIHLECIEFCIDLNVLLLIHVQGMYLFNKYKYNIYESDISIYMNSVM